MNKTLAASVASQLRSQDVGRMIGSAVRVSKDEWRINLEAMDEAFRQNLPTNWHAIESDPLDVVDVITDMGLCVVWAPRAELIDSIVTEADIDKRWSRLAIRSVSRSRRPWRQWLRRLLLRREVGRGLSGWTGDAAGSHRLLRCAMMAAHPS